MSELEEIRERVAGHTPGPWIALRADEEEHDYMYKMWEPLEGSGQEVVSGVALSKWEATIPDALLLAAAPDLLRIATEYERENDEQAKRIRELRKALEWYAAKVGNCNRSGEVGTIARDNLAKDVGRRAEAALAKSKETP